MTTPAQRRRRNQADRESAAGVQSAPAEENAIASDKPTGAPPTPAELPTTKSTPSGSATSGAAERGSTPGKETANSLKPDSASATSGSGSAATSAKAAAAKAAAEIQAREAAESKSRKDTTEWLRDPWEGDQSAIGQLRQELRIAEERIAQLEILAGPPELREMRATIIRELAVLLPIAVKNARSKGGSPALLRLILRSLKSL